MRDELKTLLWGVPATIVIVACTAAVVLFEVAQMVLIGAVAVTFVIGMLYVVGTLTRGAFELWWELREQLHKQ